MIAKTAKIPTAGALNGATKPKRNFLDQLNKELTPQFQAHDLQNIDKISPKELLGYQLKASSYHMRVEIVAKVADSFLGTVRRLSGS